MNDSFLNRYGLQTPNYDQSLELKNSSNVQQNIKNISTRYGADFYNALNTLYQRLTGNVLEMDKVENSLDIIEKIKTDMTKKYLYSLVFPEKHKGARIPTKFPVPSCTFQQSDFVIVTVNSSGNFALQWSPQNLSASTANNEIVLNVANTLTGQNLDTTYTTQPSLTSSLVTNFSSFRVVSACLMVQYIGSYINLQGVFGSGMDISSVNTNSYDANYSNFSNVDDRLWSQTVRSDEGLKIVYFPKDYSDLTFIKPNVTPAVNNLPTAIRLCVYGQNLPPSTQCVRIDIIKNVEAIPGPAFADILDIGYLDTDSFSDHAIDAAKIMTNSNIVSTSMSEQASLEKVLKSSGNDYLTILPQLAKVQNNKSRAEVIDKLYEDSKQNNGKMDRKYIM